MGLTKVSYAMINGEVANVLDYGAIGDGVTDDSAAFNAALAANKTVFVPTGTYNLASRITVGQQAYQTLFGENKTATVLRSNSGTEPVIYINASIPGININTMTIDRSVAPTANTAIGIDYNRIGEGVIDNVVVQNHQVGIRLGEAGFSRLSNSTVQKNINSGIIMSSGDTGQLQWSLYNVLSTMNGASGIVVTSQAGTAVSTSLGEWIGVSTFANSTYGIAVLGDSGRIISGVRLSDSFLGGDGNTELYLNSYGGQHKIENSFFELAGQTPTGPTYTTPKSNVGYGVYVSANNDSVSIIGNRFSGMSYSSIDVSSTDSVIVGNAIINSGIALAVGERSGVRIRQGVSLVSGNLSKNTTGNASQQYGFYKDGDTVTYNGNIATGNTVADFGGASVVNSNLVGNTGTSFNNIIADIYYTGVKVLGPRNTGWTAMTGTQNKNSTYDTSTVTLSQLAQRVNALQAALTTHGLIGS